MSSDSDSWKKRGEAQEGEFFRKQNEKALERIQKRQEEEKPRLSPITGEVMKERTYMGVVIDVCEKSGGIWLDAGEMEEIIKLAKESGEGEENWLTKFFGDMFQTN